MNYQLYLSIALILLCSCSMRNNEYSLKTIKSDTCFSEVGKVEFAKGFSICQSLEGCRITVFNPWNISDTLARYLLTKESITCEDSGQYDFIIKTPVKNIAVLSSVYLGMFKLLGESDRIIASNNARYIYDSALYSRYQHGSLTDLGESLEMNAEAVIGVYPDLLMRYIYGGKDINDKRIIDAGIPIAYNLEFMEPHPLGRAEWIKFVAAFIDKSQLADSLFNTIRKEYQILASLTRKSPNRPTVLDGSSYKGVWYAAGGLSFPAKLYADAGADYYWKDDSSRGSIPLNFEVIIDKQADADFWIGPSTGSKKQLLDIESRYELLKSFRNNNVYFFGKRMNSNGGLDYYESGVTRPDILLKDLISVFHPELTDSDYQLVYLSKVHD